jgi:CheY-like chemotaxis protein
VAKPTVLVCDDDQGILDMLQYVLQGNGLDVVLVDTGEKALKRLRQGGIDVMLLDRVMPGMLGEETLSTIKSQESTRGVPVVMLTSSDDMSTISKCLKLGAAEFITKPVNLQLLMQVIAKLLPNGKTEGKRSGSTAAPPSRSSGGHTTLSGRTTLPGKTTSSGTPAPAKPEHEALKRDVLRMAEVLEPILAELNKRYEGAVSGSPNSKSLREAAIRVSEIQLLLQELKGIVDPPPDA